jgi:hypothetical protein
VVCSTQCCSLNEKDMKRAGGFEWMGETCHCIKGCPSEH